MSFHSGKPIRILGANLFVYYLLTRIVHCSRQIKTEGRNDFFLGKTAEPLVVEEPVVEHGLAGSWTIDDDVGGICHY